MRLGLLVIALAACSSTASARPTWPKATVREVDGGESLAPREAARAVAAAVEDDRTADQPADKSSPPSPSPATATGATADKPGSTGQTATPADEPIMTEEIVIEIEE